MAHDFPFVSVGRVSVQLAVRVMSWTFAVAGSVSVAPDAATVLTSSCPP